MDYRTGQCSQCGAQYKIPASFAHNVARCKVCKGVVHLGPAPAVKSAEGAKPVAPRMEPAAPAVPPRKVVPAPAAQRSPRPSAPPSEPRKTAPAIPPRPVPERAPLPSGRRTDATPAEHGRERRAVHPQRKLPVAGLVSGIGLVVAAALLFLFRGQLMGSDPGSGEVTAPPAPLAADPRTPAGTPEETGEAENPADERASALPVEGSPLAAGGEPEPESGAPAAEPKPARTVDPSSVDLTAIEDFGPVEDTTAEEWAEMTGWMEQWMDVEAGASGNKARMRLLEKKRKAIPVILNAFKRLDFATREGRSNGDLCQKSLRDLCHGTGFDWKYADDAAGRPVDHPEDVYFCKRVVQSWAELWKKGLADIEHWIRALDLDKKDPAEAARLRALQGAPAGVDAASEAEDLDPD